MRRIFIVFGLFISVMSLWAAPRCGRQPVRTAAMENSHIKVSYATNLTPEQLVLQSLLGSGVTVSNVKFNSSSSIIGNIEGGKQIGTFTADQTLFPEFAFSDGLIMTTGYLDVAEGPNSEKGATSALQTTYSCPLLQKMEPEGEHNNPAALEFDFSANSDFISFRYIFASEEYPEYVGTNFNDMFAFYITDLTTNITKNIAIIPGTTQTVCINNVNINSYSQYYHEVPTNSYHMQFDAYLSPFTAEATIVPNRKYHMTLVICHLADFAYDSGVFIEGNSFHSLVENTDVHACDSYFWEGKTYTQSGTYQKTYHISETVDSVITLNLQIHHPTSETINLTVCTSELPYTWRDTVFDSKTAVGNYSYTFDRKSMYGCDSTVMLNLKVLPSYNQQEVLSVCANDLPYSWRDTTFGSQTTVGTHPFTFHRQTTLGCDSTVTLILKILPYYERTEMVTICPSELPYTWEDTVFGKNTSTGMYTYRFHRQMEEGCDSIITLQLKVRPNTTVDLYDDVFVDSTYSANNFTLSAHHVIGDYTYDHTDRASSGCDSITTLHLSVLPDPFVPRILAMPVICNDELSFDLSYDYTTVLYAPKTVTIQFDKPTSSVGFYDVSDMVSKDKSVLISLPKDVRPDVYRGLATFASDRYQTSLAFDFMVRYPASVIAQKWNNLLAMRDSTGNGGYIFDEYEWYVNNEKIPSQARSYLYLGEGNSFSFGEEYCAALRRQGEDYFIFTCPVQPMKHTDVSLFPTLVQEGQPISYAPGRKAGLPATNLTNPIEVSIYNTSGQLYDRQSLMSDGEYIVISAPTSSGAYFVHITSGQNLNETHRLLVLTKF